jgi:hypothetical protein
MKVMTQIGDIHETTRSTSAGGIAPTIAATGPQWDAVDSLRRSGSSSQDGATGTATKSPARFEPSISRLRGGERLDPALLERAAEVLEDIEHADPEAMSLGIESLRYVTCQLWLTAALASMYHRSILAIVESVILSAEQITAGQAVALRGAIKDLAQPKLSEQFVDVVRSRFIDEGHNPLAPLGAAKEDTDGGKA